MAIPAEKSISKPEDIFTTPEWAKRGNCLIKVQDAGWKKQIIDRAISNPDINQNDKILICTSTVISVQRYYEYLQTTPINEKFQIKPFVYDISAKKMNFGIGICTFELASLILENAKNNSNLHPFKLIIIDGIHAVGDSNRGPNLERMIDNIKDSRTVQIIGLSAIINTFDSRMYQKWINCSIFRCSDRIYDVDQYLFLETGELYRIENGIEIQDDNVYEFLKTVDGDNDMEIRGTSMRIVQLFRYILLQNQPNQSKRFLIFVNSAENSRKMAQKIAKFLPPNPDMDADRKELINTIKSLKDIPDSLTDCIMKGVSYHNSVNLTLECRKEIENAFQNNTINIIITTHTEIQGITTDYIIIRDASKSLSLLRYSELVSHAYQFPSNAMKGEVFFVDSSENKDTILELADYSKKQCISRFNSDNPKPNLNDYFLTFPSIDKEVIRLIFDATEQANFENFEDCIQTYHEVMQILRLKPSDNYDKCLLYLIIPTRIEIRTPNYFKYVNLWELVVNEFGKYVQTEISPHESPDLWNRLQKNVKESYLRIGSPDTILNRIYFAAVLWELINEMPISEIELKYHIQPGALQNLHQAVVRYAAKMTEFISFLKNYYMKSKKCLYQISFLEFKLDQMRKRLKFSCKPDIFDLLRLGAGKCIARGLFILGYQTLNQLGKSSEIDLANKFELHKNNIEIDREIYTLLTDPNARTKGKRSIFAPTLLFSHSKPVPLNELRDFTLLSRLIIKKFLKIQRSNFE